jgi:hypothetical protein
MDHARLHSILKRMAAVLAHLTGLPAGLPARSQIEHIYADVTALEAAAGNEVSESVSLADRVRTLETAVADLHAALSDKPAPAAVRKAVADVEVPQPDA